MVVPKNEKLTFPEVGKSRQRIIWDSQIGIYRIVNEEKKTVYVGQSKNVPVRIRSHKSALKNNAYSFKGDKLKALQDDYNKFGIGSFVFEQIFECDPDDLLEWETYYCKLHAEEGYTLYNYFINTDIGGLMCPAEFKEIITKLINKLDSGQIKKEQIEQALWQMENY